MNEIQRLIHEMCPNGVPMVALNSLCNVLRGKRLTKDKLSPNGKYPVFHGGLEPLGYYDSSNRPANSVMVINVGASAGTVGFCDHEFWSSDGCFSISHNPLLHSKFLYYYLFGQTKNIQRKVRVAGIPTLDNAVVEKIQIPLPPLPIQQRIVEILDKFTSLVSSLDSEIALRQKQYEYYRNKLLSFEEGEFEWKTLPEISTNCDRQRKPITGSKRIAGRYPYYGASGIVDYVESYIFDGNYLLISEDGANLLARSTPIAFSIEGKNWVNNHAHVLKFENMNTQRIVELYLNSIDLSPWISGAAQPKLNQDNLNKIPIPIPSLDRQLSIVRTLDTFESLLTNLKKERELRQKQYEYYREKLLTFA